MFDFLPGEDIQNGNIACELLCSDEPAACFSFPPTNMRNVLNSLLLMEAWKLVFKNPTLNLQAISFQHVTIPETFQYIKTYIKLSSYRADNIYHHMFDTTDMKKYIIKITNANKHAKKPYFASSMSLHAIQCQPKLIMLFLFYCFTKKELNCFLYL
jgi:hypothetical protein